MATIANLNELLVDQLKDLYSAESQLTKALPKMAKATHSATLRDGFKTHLEETKQQLERLKQIGEHLGEKMTGKTCKAMAGLIEEGGEATEAKGPGPIIDLCLVAAAQRVEHYEISGYGTARSMAEHLGLDAVAELLRLSLDEESATNEKLTQVSQDELFTAAEAEGVDVPSTKKAKAGSRG